MVIKEKKRQRGAVGAGVLPSWLLLLLLLLLPREMDGKNGRPADGTDTQEKWKRKKMYFLKKVLGTTTYLSWKCPGKKSSRLSRVK
jgi:hypothetical protein